MIGINTPSFHENQHSLAPHETIAALDGDMRKRTVTLYTKLDRHVHVTLDTNLVDPVLLQDEVALENALCVLEGHLQNAAVDQDTLLKDLLSIRNFFGLVFSGK